MDDKEVLVAIRQRYTATGQPVVGQEAAWWGAPLTAEQKEQLVRLLALEHTSYMGRWKNTRSLAKKLAKAGVDIQVIEVSTGPVVLEVPAEPITPTSEFRTCLSRAIELAEVLPIVSLREALEDVDQLAGALEARFVEEEEVA